MVVEYHAGMVVAVNLTALRIWAKYRKEMRRMYVADGHFYSQHRHGTVIVLDHQGVYKVVR